MSYNPEGNNWDRFEANHQQGLEEVQNQLNAPGVRGTPRERELLETRGRLEEQYNWIQAEKHGNKRSMFEYIGYGAVLLFLVVVLIIVGVQIF